MKERKYDHTISLSSRGPYLSMTKGDVATSRSLSWASVEQAKFDLVEHTLDEMERQLETAKAA